MMTKAKLVLGMAVGLAAVLLAGWFWGRSDRSELTRALQASELRGELLAARSAVAVAFATFASSDSIRPS